MGAASASWKEAATWSLTRILRGGLSANAVLAIITTSSWYSPGICTFNSWPLELAVHRKFSSQALTLA